MAIGPVSVGSSPYTLTAATKTVLGGIKVGSNLTVTADGTVSAPAPYALTADKITAALGFSPASAASTAQLPYSIVYDHSYVGTGTTSNTIPLAADYDAIALIYADKKTYPPETELSRQFALKAMITQGTGSFSQNYICLKGLPDTQTGADKVNPGMIVIRGGSNGSSTFLYYKDHELHLSSTSNFDVGAGFACNSSSCQYHVFGIRYNSDILPVT